MGLSSPTPFSGEPARSQNPKGGEVAPSGPLQSNGNFDQLCGLNVNC